MAKIVKGIRDDNDELYQFTPPPATETDYGGIKAKAKTNEKQPVVIDSSTGYLYTDDSKIETIATEVNDAHISSNGIKFNSIGERYNQIEDSINTIEMKFTHSDEEIKAELANMRVGADGTVYETTGDALRTLEQKNKEKADIQDFFSTLPVNDKYIEINGFFGSQVDNRYLVQKAQNAKVRMFLIDLCDKKNFVKVGNAAKCSYVRSSKTIYQLKSEIEQKGYTFNQISSTPEEEIFEITPNGFETAVVYFGDSPNLSFEIRTATTTIPNIRIKNLKGIAISPKAGDNSKTMCLKSEKMTTLQIPTADLKSQITISADYLTRLRYCFTNTDVVIDDEEQKEIADSTSCTISDVNFKGSISVTNQWKYKYFLVYIGDWSQATNFKLNETNLKSTKNSQQASISIPFNVVNINLDKGKEGVFVDTSSKKSIIIERSKIHNVLGILNTGFTRLRYVFTNQDVSQIKERTEITDGGGFVSWDANFDNIPKNHINITNLFNYKYLIVYLGDVETIHVSTDMSDANALDDCINPVETPNGYKFLKGRQETGEIIVNHQITIPFIPSSTELFAPSRNTVAENVESYHNLYDEFVTKGFCTKQLLGTVHDLPIYRYDFRFADSYMDKSDELIPLNNGTYAPKKEVLINSGMHGNEKGAPFQLYEFLKLICSNIDYFDILMHYNFTIIPICNPTGYNATTRVNADGNDINRDGFDHATPEGALIAPIMKERKWELYLDMHQTLAGQQNAYREVFGLLAQADRTPATIAALPNTAYREASAKTLFKIRQKYNIPNKQYFYPWNGTSNKTWRNFIQDNAKYSLCYETSSSCYLASGTNELFNSVSLQIATDHTVNFLGALFRMI